MDRGYHSEGGLLQVSQFPYHPPLSRAIIKAAEELGHPIRDVNGIYHTGFQIAQTTNRNGSRLSASRAFVRPFKNRKNLDIVMNATVTKVLVSPQTKQAYGVELLRDGNLVNIYSTKEVIVSGGAVNSPQILLLSGIGPRKELDQVKVPLVHDLPGVGKNLQNHVAYFVNFHINDTNTAPLNWATAMEYLLFRDGLMSGTGKSLGDTLPAFRFSCTCNSAGISEVTGFINSKYNDPNLDHPDLQFFFGGFLANCARTGMVGERVDNGSRQINIIPTVLHPKSRGELRLKDRNPRSHPLIFANYFTHPDDVKVLVEGIRFALRLAETKGAVDILAVRQNEINHIHCSAKKLDKTPVAGCEGLTFGSDNYWECAVKRQTGPENHQAGSCKMGPKDDPMAVVDAQLRRKLHFSDPWGGQIEGDRYEHHAQGDHWQHERTSDHDRGKRGRYDQGQMVDVAHVLFQQPPEQPESESAVGRAWGVEATLKGGRGLDKHDLCVTDL
ncbi:hypothetical protein D910_04330 [Dendroctonus ponderosae]|uniref:Glucose-methanol-choline oxidoreductase N-terminal domain-containing protein n=1 Tax=Dendroctonus ponderosae TaxID=77166 RepID=U4U1J4_DENPD|nr:hypothetical protein D910_04330 [Dendroctonus ponderosae]